MAAPRMVAAETADRGRMHYLVDADLDFVPEVRDFLDWKALRCAPVTIAAYCYRLWWYYRFLHRRRLDALRVEPADLTDFVIWLCDPHRETGEAHAPPVASPLGASTVNQILNAVASLYAFLVRRGALAQSPVRYVEVPRGAWARERDLLAHTRKAQTARRSELKLAAPQRLPQTVAPDDFQRFLDGIRVDPHPGADPAGFRDRLLCLLLKEGGFRVGELLGQRMADLNFGERGVHVRFRADNENGARAKAGYGRDRLVHLPADILGMLDVYITDVWATAVPATDHLWLVLKEGARDRSGRPTYGTALTRAAVQAMFRHYSRKARVHLHPHMLRHTHATELVRSYSRDGEPVDWKYIQERLGHASVVTTLETYVHFDDGDRRRAYDHYRERQESRRAG